jgi:hypothetical protein
MYGMELDLESSGHRDPGVVWVLCSQVRECIPTDPRVFLTVDVSHDATRKHALVSILRRRRRWHVFSGSRYPRQPYRRSPR